ncbi:MAG: tetratricopeptide repeat protein [Rhodospirillaceae bacterium]|nr:tetratricopeptide repeat protein [Rhodospirillaceae bacterium]MBL6930402.1 tetratricopeptide repeat protein [Rhodospirillales bacterium]
MKPSPEIRRRLNAFGKLADDELGLTETALVLARAERPGIDPAVYERHLEKLTDDVAAYAGKDAGSPKGGLEMRVEALQQVIARRAGYGGSDDAYEDAECANLMRVIDRREGLPTLLGIIYIHVARALGWEIHGLDFPPRFLVRLEFAGARCILDPFDGGKVMEPFDLRDIYKAVSGPQVEIQPRHTEAMSNRAIILRSRRNAKVLHLRSENLEGALDVVETLLMLAPVEPALWREAGILNARLDRVPDAVAALEQYLETAGADASRFRTSILLQELRGRLN